MSIDMDHEEEMNYYMSSVLVHDTDGGRWLRWMDAICFPDYEAFDFDGTRWWILEYRGENVGYSGYRKINQDVGELYRAGVLPKHRGQGFQKYMALFRERKMKEAGLSTAVSVTSCDNFRSMNNLIACGYVACDKSNWPLLGDYGDNVVYWRKKLSK